MKKQKKFFTVVPLQEILYNADGSIKQNKLTSGHYQPVGNSRLEYGDTRFPIIPVLHGYAQPEDLIQVVAITPDNPFAAYHLEELRQEVEQVEGQIADILAANNRRQKTGNVRSALERAQRQTEEEKP